MLESIIATFTFKNIFLLLFNITLASIAISVIIAISILLFRFLFECAIKIYFKIKNHGKSKIKGPKIVDKK